MGLKEAQAAELLLKLEKFFDEDGGFPKILQRIKVLEESVEGFEGIDIRGVITDFDKVKSVQDRLVKAIKSSKRGCYVPGAEDVDFCLTRALVGWQMARGQKHGFEKAGAMQEYEIMKAASETDHVKFMKAAITSGDGESAGLFIPDQVIPDVIGAIYTRSAFLALFGAEGETRISVLEGLTGGNVKVPKFNGGVIAYWVGEEDELAESLTKVGDMTLSPKKIGVLVKLTDSMMRFAGFGFDSLLRTDMERSVAKKIDWTIPYGTGGDNMPRGLFSRSGIRVFRAEDGATMPLEDVNDASAPTFLADWDGGELDYDGIDDMRLALEEDDIELDDADAPIISSKRFFSRLKRRKVDHYSTQTTNQAYLIGAPIITNARLREAIGDYSWTNQIPNTNLPGASVGAPTDSTNQKYTDVITGNLSNIVAGRWAGIELSDDGGRGAGFAADATFMKMRMYFDTNVRQERALIVCPDAQVRD